MKLQCDFIKYMAPLCRGITGCIRDLYHLYRTRKKVKPVSYSQIRKVSQLEIPRNSAKIRTFIKFTVRTVSCVNLYLHFICFVVLICFRISTRGSGVLPWNKRVGKLKAKDGTTEGPHCNQDKKSDLVKRSSQLKIPRNLAKIRTRLCKV